MIERKSSLECSHCGNADIQFVELYCEMSVYEYSDQM
jgi:hypothetical protein